MLILSRRKKQQVIVTVPPSAEPTTLAVTLTRTGGGRAWLGFDAPRAVRVLRMEVLERETHNEEETSP